MPDLEIQVTDAEYRRIRELIDALRTPCKVALHPKSPWNKPEFESEFRSKLLFNHCIVKTPLFQESFDAAFISACHAAGCKVREAPSGQRFWDVEVDDRKISLKSTKAKSLKMDKLMISKLTEAAWIQDCRSSATRCKHTKDLFQQYCGMVDAILQFRYFRETELYELVEIPVSLFSQVQDVGRRHFDADGPTIRIPIGKDPCDFALKLDRSDAKITISNINKQLCTVHGTWQIG